MRNSDKTLRPRVLDGLRALATRINVTIALTAAALGAVSAPAAAAPQAPVWSIYAVSYPTVFAPGSASTSDVGPGPAYMVEAVNVGAGSTSGVFTVTDTLPPSVVPAVSTSPYGFYGAGAHSATLACEATGQTVTCTGGGPGKPDLLSGEELNVKVPVAVEEGAPTSIQGEVSIEGGGGARRTIRTTTTVGQTPAGFGFLEDHTNLFERSIAADGSAVTQAGAHPDNLEVGVAFPTVEGPGSLRPSGQGVRDIRTVLPVGVSVDPEATPKCTEAQLESPGAIKCPDASQVGVIDVTLSLGGEVSTSVEPLFNMVPQHGVPAEFGFSLLEGVYQHLLGRVRSDGSYELAAEANDILAKAVVLGADVDLWGNPSAEVHDGLRLSCLESKFFGALCPVPRTGTAFVTMPSACGGPTLTSASADDWLEPGAFVSASARSGDLDGNPVGVQGCGVPGFKPSISAQPTSGVADSPSGLDFDLHQPQDLEYEGTSAAALKDATVVLPEGLTLNPSAAGGREGCSSSQIGLVSGVEQTPIRFKETPQECPDAAKIGAVQVDTPLLGHPLTGAVYLAKPFDNPFDSLLAIYLAVEDEQSGIIAKLAGKVDANPVTGQLTTSFSESPQLPLEDVKLQLFDGPRAALITPLACGVKTTTSTLVPWSTPEGANADPSDSFDTSVAPNGSGCPQSEAQAPFAPGLSAGTVSPVAGAFSPVVFRVSREDGSQRLGSIDASLPEGVLGDLAGVAFCSDAQIAVAAARSGEGEGALEQSSPSCPESSQVGVVNITAGAGSEPYAVQGKAYLAGPYKNAPLSLAIVTPAVAGPFDLGTVVVRVALYIDRSTAQISAVSDPLPTILDGIPLDVRSVSLEMNRSGFTFNPTSCEPMSIGGQAVSTLGQTAALSNRFQVGGCQGLPFKPVLSTSTAGKTSKANGASLTVKLAQKAGEANIHKVELAIPTALPTRLTTLQQACSEAQFNTNPAGCPPGAFIGTAKATTPVLSVPLVGPAVLVSHGGAAFPDVEFLLQANERGSVIQIDLDGKTDIKKGITYSRFETVPDAPITSFETVLPEGPHSILGVNLPASAKYSLCGQKLAIATTITGQNGAQVTQSSPVAVQGCSASLSFTRSIKKRTVTLSVYAPAAGKLTASGKGLTTVTKTAKGQENLTVTLKQKTTGKLKTTVKVLFTPSKGKKQTKTVKVEFKR